MIWFSTPKCLRWEFSYINTLLNLLSPLYCILVSYPVWEKEVTQTHSVVFPLFICSDEWETFQDLLSYSYKSCGATIRQKQILDKIQKADRSEKLFVLQGTEPLKVILHKQPDREILFRYLLSIR